MIESSEKLNLFQLSNIIGTLKNLQQYEQLFHHIIDRIKRSYDAQTCAIILIDPKTEYLRVENSEGLSRTFCKVFRKMMTTGEIGKLLWTGSPIVISDSKAEPDRTKEVKLEKKFGSCIAVPITVNQRSRGYLYVDHTDEGYLSQDDVPVLQMFADIAGLGLHKYRLEEKVRRLERIDHVTGLGTYALFIEKMDEIYTRAKTFGENFAIILCDIDNFKYVVNTYGHDTADILLKEIGGVIRNRLRDVDTGCRYGVDEFAILLSKTGLKEAMIFAGELRKYIDDNLFTDKKLDSSISVGLSVYPVNGSTIEELMVTGKHALFEAQRAGRNKVMHYESLWYASEPVSFN